MNSKKKGGNYERDVARILSVWATSSEENLVYWRQISSGSVSTVAKRNNKNASGLDGDFICIAEDTHPKFKVLKQFLQVFFVDSKCLGNVHLCMINSKNQKSNQLLNEIKKVFSEAKRSNKLPMLICKATNDRKIDDFIILPTYLDLYSQIDKHNSMYYHITNEDGTKLFFQLIPCFEFFSMNSFDDFVSSSFFVLQNMQETFLAK